MNIFKLKTNLKLEVDGKWVPMGGGAEIKVARIGNERYAALAKELGRPHVHAFRHQSAIENATILDGITKKCVATCALLDWKNLEDEKGEVIPYSPAKAEELFIELPDFYRFVLEVANAAETFRGMDMEEARGNSEAVSNGSANGATNK